MGKDRLEAFSDCVISIIITIMVLEMKVPHGNSIATLKPLFTVFLSYILSFFYVAIYWNNHHHLLHTVHKVRGYVLWANMHLLFWLSLFPFTTGWMGENNFSPIPTALYGCVLLLAAFAYKVLQETIIISEGSDALLSKALGLDWKGKLSLVLYVVGIACTFISQWVALATYITVAMLWIIPDKRIEKVLVE